MFHAIAAKFSLLISAILGSSAFALAVAAISLFAAIFAVVVVFEVKRTLATQPLHGPKTAHPEKEVLAHSADDATALKQSLKELESFMRETRKEADSTANALREIVRVLADNRVAKLTAGDQNGNADVAALRHLYENARSELSSFATSLQEVTPSVDALKACPTYQDTTLAALVQALVRGYERIEGMDSELAAKITVLGKTEPNVSEEVEEARRKFEAGSLTPEGYLQKIFSIQPTEKPTLPNLKMETANYSDVAASTVNSYLEWIDRINELRDLAMEKGNNEIASSCTQIIRQSQSVLDPLSIQLEDVEIGMTQYDARLHELLHTVPRPGMRPETIIGVRKLGRRKNGKTVCKPQVIVAAAGK